MQIINDVIDRQCSGYWLVSSSTTSTYQREQELARILQAVISHATLKNISSRFIKKNHNFVCRHEYVIDFLYLLE
jgi:hypothetical protein